MTKHVISVAAVWFLAASAIAQPSIFIEKALEGSPATQPTTQPAAQVAVPTSQPINIVVQQTPPAGPRTITEVLAGTRLGKLAQGEQVSLKDLQDPIFWIDTVRDLIVALIGFIPRFLVALLFLLVFWLIYRGVRRLTLASTKKAAVDPSIRDMLGHLIKWTIMGFGVVIACNQIGIQIAALLTGVSIIGLAIGFAAQETLANFIAGVVIFWDKPFRVGDWLEIADAYGQVQRVTFRSTRLLDLDGDAIVFPNTYMLANKLINRSTHPMTRVAVPIGIAYKESIETARKVLLETLRGDGRIVTDPQPFVVVEACADSSVNLLMFFWIRDESVERRIRFEYIEKAKKALDAANIQIPFPHLQLFMEETAAVAKLAGAPGRN